MQSNGHSQLLFLCTGNYYRSRFAEVLFNTLARQFGLPWLATSRGLALERGTHNVGPMARSAIRTLEGLGVPPGEHFTRIPQSVCDADFTAAHLVIALKHAEHYPLMQSRFPKWADTIEYWHIEDEPGVLPLLECKVRDFVKQMGCSTSVKLRDC
jgi:protein-tyrosine phosphatase